MKKYKVELQDMGLWIFACQLTAVCCKYLGLREVTWRGSWGDNFLDQLITDIIDSGNFGRKGIARSTTLALNQEKGLVSSFAAMTKKRYKLCERYPVLLPVGMLMNRVRYINLVLHRKKKLINARAIAAGEERIILYKQFRLFKEG